LLDKTLSILLVLLSGACLALMVLQKHESKVINHCLIEKLAWSSLIALVATLILGILTAPISYDAVTNLCYF